MKQRTSLVSLLVALMFTMSLLAGCELPGATTKTDKSTKEPQKLQKVVVAEAVRGEYWLPVYLANELGYFKEEGLDVEFTTYKDGPLALLGLIADNAQFCVIGFEPVLRAYEQGKSTKVILTTTDNQPYMFATQPGINNISDLKGKVIFAGMPSSAPYAFARAVLKNAGLDPDKDVTFANLEYGAEVAALSKGNISGSYLRASMYPAFKEIGANILVDATDREQHKKVFGSEKYEAMVIQVTDKFIKTNPETVQKFTNAVVKAMQWQSEHTDEEIAAKMSPMFPGRKINADLINTVKRSLSKDGYFTANGYETVQNFCLDVSIITKPIPFDAVIDQTFLKRAHETVRK